MNKREEAYTLEMSEAVTISGSNAENIGKKKLSPRSQQRVQKIVKKRVAEFKRETIVDEDANSMIKLCQALKAKRVADKEQGEKRKTEKKEKQMDKSCILEDQNTKENNLFLSEIKVVKKTPKKVMSDLSQIYNRPKKVKKNMIPSTAALTGKPIPATTTSKEIKFYEVTNSQEL